MTEEAPAKPIMGWNDLQSRPQPKPDATVTYGADALQLVDVWRPSGKGPHPAVIMIHGGCWQTSVAERDIMNWIADDLRKAGVGVWNIEYRGVDRGGGYPGTYEDVGMAADMFAARRSEYGFAGDGPVIAIGHSAGGHLALWLARRSALANGDALRGSNPVKLDLAISHEACPTCARRRICPIMVAAMKARVRWQKESLRGSRRPKCQKEARASCSSTTTSTASHRLRSARPMALRW